MKEKDVFVDDKRRQLILYVEKEDGSYGSFQTGSYITRHYIDDYFLKINNLKNALAEKLKAGKISPVYFYMTLLDMTAKELASRVGVSKFSVNRHLNLIHFKKIKLNVLKRYADFFEVPIANMFQLLVTKENGKQVINSLDEESLAELNIEQIKTDNPFVVLTKVEVIKK